MVCETTTTTTSPVWRPGFFLPWGLPCGWCSGKATEGYEGSPALQSKDFCTAAWLMAACSASTTSSPMFVRARTAFPLDMPSRARQASIRGTSLGSSRIEKALLNLMAGRSMGSTSGYLAAFPASIVVAVSSQSGALVENQGAKGASPARFGQDGPGQTPCGAVSVQPLRN